MTYTGAGEEAWACCVALSPSVSRWSHLHHQGKGLPLPQRYTPSRFRQDSASRKG